MSRLTVWHKKYLPIILQLAAKHHTNVEIAESLGVKPTTFSDWVNGKNPKVPADLRERITVARLRPVREVEANYFKRANGYKTLLREIEIDPTDPKHEKILSIKVKEKEFPPNVAAATFILTNKLAEEYKNRQSHEISGRIGVKHYIGWTPENWLKSFPDWPARKQLPGGNGNGDGKMIDITPTNEDGKGSA